MRFSFFLGADGSADSAWQGMVSKEVGDDDLVSLCAEVVL